MQFVIRATSRTERLSALCREFGISRPTGYLWRRRYEQCGTLTEIRERSRRPHGSPSRTGSRQEQRVIALRKQKGWGAKKLRVLLKEEQIPLAVRTIHRILERNGLVSERTSSGTL
jgi:putative transposase